MKDDNDNKKKDLAQQIWEMSNAPLSKRVEFMFTVLIPRLFPIMVLFGLLILVSKFLEFLTR